MQEYLSAVSHTQIPPYRMVKAQVISTNPEEEVISFLEDWVKAKGIGITDSRRFGFDVPLPEEEKTSGQRGYEYWIAVPDNVVPDDKVSIVDFSGGDYIVMRITEPFIDPFDRIPKGWQALVEHVRQDKLPADWCSDGGCLEEVVCKGGVTYMDIFIRLRK